MTVCSVDLFYHMMVKKTISSFYHLMTRTISLFYYMMRRTMSFFYQLMVKRGQWHVIQVPELALVIIANIVVITTRNLLVCYLIPELDYNNCLLIDKLSFWGIEFEVFGKTSFNNNSTTKSNGTIKNSQCVLWQSKNSPSITFEYSYWYSEA